MAAGDSIPTCSRKLTGNLLVEVLATADNGTAVTVLSTGNNASDIALKGSTFHC